MRVWLYYRLSRDEDEELNSLRNQRSMIEAYALSNGHEIVGESFDDNVSGMHFEREGIARIYEVVDAGLIDAIVVKDLSRLGRHRTHTALFIDYLREHHVRVISATEGIDTFNENDDLIIGFKGLVNDFYARDGSRRVRTGYRQKQKNGIVITPPFGYWKDRNTDSIHLHPEAAETVRLIYDYYLQGIGQKEIARRLNRLGRKTPAQLRAERYGGEFYATRKNQSGQYVWTYVSVKNILTEEGYTGVLINHRTETRHGKASPVPADQWQRHEDFYPAIVTKEAWQKTQALLKQNARPAVQNRATHRYTGLLTCGNCGQPFVPMIRYWNGSRRVEYVCKGYHRQGKEFCSSHRIREECLDAQVMQYAQTLRESWAEEQKNLQRLYKQWSLRQPALDREIAQLREQIRQTEEDIDELLMLRIQATK